MINKVLVRIMYALIFGGVIAYVAQGLFRDGWVSAAFGVATVAVFGLWNLRRATVPRDRQLGPVGRFLITPTGLVIGLAVVALAGVLVWLGLGDCPPSPGPTTCDVPSHMNW
ncbi:MULTISPECIES: hypothetical protein [unclassified Streptomyces]|uniref:hypothetical protein n=1 Tax=unclassified Streptomyces TaxID=2593676 RepID=UPI0022575010|nr:MULTISPECIES: hypothetical protein [unclassified Streptomyces]MCX4827624.1 hypothetical protein [Streptomyces sp. NBC_01016]